LFALLSGNKGFLGLYPTNEIMQKLNFQSNANETIGETLISPEVDFVSETEKTRILMIGTSLTKTRGGISTLIGGILRSDLKNDFAIDYIESQAEDFRGFGKFLLAIRAIFAFIGKISTKNPKNPKLVYVHVGSNASLYRETFFVILAKIFGQKTVAHFHAGDVEEYLEKQSKLGKKYISWAIGLSDKLIAVSANSANKLRNIAPKNEIEIIVNAINTKPFAFSTNRFEARNGTVRILFVGAMGKLKGETDLAQAVKLLIEKHPNLRVSFLGFGGEKLEKYCAEIGIEKVIEFIGAVSLEERLEFFENADIFALPTYAEAMPMSVIEAMAAGLPIVSTTVGGIPELIDENEEGFLVKPANVGKLAEKLSKLIGDKNLRVKMGEKAQIKVKDKLDFAVFTEKLKTCLIELTRK
jgi:glycosyltransferase involved in cell wall biosynthesis